MMLTALAIVGLLVLGICVYRLDEQNVLENLSIGCLLLGVLVLGGACTPSRPGLDKDIGSGGGFGRNSAEARITHLISEGQFAEAEVLISESSASGLLDEAAAISLRRTLAEQSLKLGDLPASLQRVAGFPARLRDYTRFDIQRMFDRKDFSVATKKELQTALKLLKQQKRLMEKN
jgi:hypothetical protein